MKKLRSTRGETLIETLVATLVITLSSILLLNMAVTSTTINKRSDEVTKQYNLELAAAETGVPLRDGSLTINVTKIADAAKQVTYAYDISFSSTEKKELNSYVVKEATP